jgi:hypothetical protein
VLKNECQKINRGPQALSPAIFVYYNKNLVAFKRKAKSFYHFLVSLQQENPYLAV